MAPRAAEERGMRAGPDATEESGSSDELQTAGSSTWDVLTEDTSR